MNINQPRKTPGKTRFYLLSSLYMEKILRGMRAGHAAADQHDRMDYHVTSGMRVAGNRSPTGGPRDTDQKYWYHNYNLFTDLDLDPDDNCQTPGGYCGNEVCMPMGTIQQTARFWRKVPKRMRWQSLVTNCVPDKFLNNILRRGGFTRGASCR